LFFIGNADRLPQKKLRTITEETFGTIETGLEASGDSAIDEDELEQWFNIEVDRPGLFCILRVKRVVAS